MNVSEHTITLRNNAEMPTLGLGTWNSDGKNVGAAVQNALVDNHYNHLDCASVYENEKEVGAALHEIFSTGQRKREDIFITSKLWNTHHAKQDVVTACKQTLQDLQLDYLDLYLMHFGIASPRDAGLEPLNKEGVLLTVPVSVRETWEAMEELVNAGLVKAIGVANFTAPMLVDLLTYAQIAPAVNQIELHPYNTQTKLVDFCRYHNIVVTGYSPLGSPGVMKPSDAALMKDAVVEAVARAHNKTAAQILLRWGIQRGTVVIPKSVHPERIAENCQVFDFVLTQDEMEQLNALDRRHRYVDPWAWWKIPYFG